MKNALLIQALMGQPQGQNWWQQIPPARRDWWANRLNAMPHADGQFQDNIFMAPPNPAAAEGLGFDKNAIHPDELRLKQY